MRVIFSRSDVAKIAEYREILNSALRKFEVRHTSQVRLLVNVSSDTLLASISHKYRPKAWQAFRTNTTASEWRGH